MSSKKRKAAPQPKAAAFFTRYLARHNGNTKKMETNTMKRAVREGTADAEREEAKAKTVKLAAGKIAASMFYDALTCPMEVGRDKEKLLIIT